MAKNILFYIPDINQSWGGVRQYSFNILKMLSENPNKEFVFYIYHEVEDKLFLDIINENYNFNLIKINVVKWRKTKFSIIFNKILILLKLKKRNVTTDFDRMLKKYSIDIVHCPYQFIPKTNEVKLITTLHDVQEIYFPEFFSPEERAYRAVNYYDFMKRSDTIIVSYNHVKQDLINYFNINKSKIHTLLIGMQFLWVNNFKYNNDFYFEEVESFLLYPANSWKHKNHIGIIEAIRLLKTQNKIVKIIFTGDFKNDYGMFLIDKIKEYALDNQIIIKGIVSQNELFGLYKNTVGVVVPTLYEAGSYPLYESIFLEKPVVCSNVTSLPETIGNEKFIFNPNDYNDIAGKIEELYFDEEYKKQSIVNSQKMKKKLISNDFVVKLYKLYNSI